MNALFALALLVSPSQAGVVMPVESGVAPAGPSAPIVPIGAPAGGLIGSPSFGGLDLRGVLPLLPSPVPGLVGPALNFVGSAPEAAAVKPEAGAAQAAPSSPAAARGRRAEQTPAIPARVSPGSPALAISRDRKAAASTPGNGLSQPVSNPLVETTSLEHARPEKAAGLGRKFFDLGSDENRGELEDGAAATAGDGQDGTSVIAQGGGGAAFGGGHGAKVNGLTASNADAAFGGSRGTSRTDHEHESMRDAVAGAPAGAASRGAVSFFRSASPNGELGVSVGAPGSFVLGFPRPLALDLSRSGLIVRVRSALGGVLVAAPAAVPVSRLPETGPSTALLERGGMLEAFSVARAHAESVPGDLTPSSRASGAAPGLLSPAAESSPVPLWWALFLLPLFAAAIRGIH